MTPLCTVVFWYLWRFQGAPGMCPPFDPITFFIFKQFSAKILQNNRLAHHPRSWHPRPGNPGSATGYRVVWVQLKVQF